MFDGVHSRGEYFGRSSLLNWLLNLLVGLQGNIGRLVELRSGKLAYRGDIDLTQYYIVSMKIVEIEPWNEESNGNWKVQVSLT